MRSYILSALVLLVFLSSRASAQQLVQIGSGFEQPVLVTHAGDGSGRLFVVEREGRIRIYRGGEVFAQPFLDIRNRVRTNGEFGLLGLAFHPDFENNRRFFIYYSPSSGSARMVVAEYRAALGDPDRAVDSETVIIEVDQPFANHNGGTIAFGPDGFLYVGLGDGGSAGDPLNHGQNLNTLLGAMLRLDVDGASLAPVDNPFVGQPGRDEIWAYGLRNPFRFSFDRGTGRLFLADVGQNRFEEIDIIERGGNYGWRIMEANSCFSPSVGCDQAGLTLPIHGYGRGDGTSVTGGVVYRGLSFPELNGLYIFGDFGSGTVWTLREDSPGVWLREVLFENIPGLVAIGEDQLGEVYLVDLFGERLLAMVGDDLDRDGVPDVDEDAAPNDGDANLDGIADRLQPHVASLQTASGDPLSLLTAPGNQLLEVGFVDNPSPQDTPGVEFPFGFLSVQIRGIPSGRAEVTLLLPSATALNSYYLFGPTPDDPQPHWHEFFAQGGNGAEIGTHTVTLRFEDGQRGDGSLAPDDAILAVGGPAFDADGTQVSFFPQMGDGTQGSLSFRTGAAFANTGPDTFLNLEFFQSDGTPMALDLIDEGRNISIERPLLRGQALTLLSSGAGDEQGTLQVGYARIASGPGVGGTLLFQRSQSPESLILFETGIPASATLTGFTVLADQRGVRQTGLALVNPPETVPPSTLPATTATLRLRLYNAEFELIAETTETLSDGHHLARFPGELFADQLPDGVGDILGTITVESDLPISAVTLRQTDRPGVEFPDEVPTLSAFPVIPGRADADQ